MGKQIYTCSELEAQAGARARLLTGNADGNGDDQNRIELSEWKTITAAVRNRRCSSPLCHSFGGSVCAVPPRKPRRSQRVESRGAIICGWWRVGCLCADV